MNFTDPLFFLPLCAFGCALAVATALMEIQIEGGNGWAGCLPSWRFAPAWMRSFMNGKDLTGYHIYLNIHLLLLFHFPLLISGWSPFLELSILSLFFLCMVLEDFLWFVLNPHFGWHSFSKGRISWYTHWVGPFPVDYYLWVFVSGLFAYLRGMVPGGHFEPSFGMLSLPLQHLVGWGIGFAVCLILIVLLMCIVTPRIARFLSQDTIEHMGHPGVCNACAREIPAKVLENLQKKGK